MARSPNYPGISLPEAIERIRKIHAKAHTHKVDAETMAKAAGYSGLNGAALTLLSAMKKYGLLEELGKDLRVSEGAMVIIADPVNSRERRAMIQKAAFSPALFQDIHAQYPGNVPGDEIVRSYLIKKGFLASAVDGVIRSFRETMELITTEGMGYIENPENPTEPDAKQMLEELQNLPNNSPPTYQKHLQAAVRGISAVGNVATLQGAVEIGAYPVSKSCTIRLLASGPYTRKTIEALIKQLELNVELEVFPEEPDQKAPAPKVDDILK